MAVPGKKASKKISSTLSLGGAEDFDIFCEIHDRSDIRLPAFGYCLDCEEHLCQHCYNTHRGPRPLRHHQLLDKDHMPHKQNLHKSSKSSSSVLKSELTKSCLKHTKEVIKYFCHDHKLPICSVCVTLDHTPTSCHVDYIPDVSEHILDSTEFKETLKDINQLTEKCCQITKSLEERVAKSTTSLRDAIVEIGNFRKEINRRLDELEKVVKVNATRFDHENKYKLIRTETACEGINKSLQASADTLKLLNSSKKADQLFTELKIAKQLIVENEIRTSQLPKATDVHEYTFHPNPAIKALLQNETSLGTLSGKKLKQPAQTKNPVPMKLSTHRNILVKTFSDEDICHKTAKTISPQNLSRTISSRGSRGLIQRRCRTLSL